MRSSFRLLILSSVLLGAACRTRLADPDAREFYVGAAVSAEAPPGLALTAGQLVSAASERFDFYVEGRIVRQWGSDDLGQIQLGVRQLLSPGHKSRLYFRYGATWVRVTGDSDFIDVPGDYLGAYAGAGYEWDVTPRLSLGPELDLHLLGGERGIGADFLPRLLFQLRLDF